MAQDVVEAAHHMDLDHFSPSLKLVYQQNKRDRDAHNEKRRQQRRIRKTQNSLLQTPDSASQVHVDHEDHDHDDNVLTISDSD